MDRKVISIDSTGKRVAAIVSAIFILLTAFFMIRWSFANMAAMRTDLPEIADLAVRLAPDDPQTHLTAAALLEKTFLPEDFQRSLAEYEEAAALSPANYLIWLELGRARERAGDVSGAETALRRAVELAPNYASPRWALGNTLARQGRTNEAFADLRYAAAANPTFAEPAVRAALQLSNGDISAVSDAIGDSIAIRAALITELTRAKRLEDAFSVWRSVSDPTGDGPFADASKTLLAALFAEKRFRSAYDIDLALRGRGRDARPGTLANGGFEEDIKNRDASVFDWQVAEGTQPQIVITEGQAHSGKRSLLIAFNSADEKALRSISQHVAVEDGKEYQFKAFYRAELKTEGHLKWEIVDADSGETIAATATITNAADWTELSCRFIPRGSEAVIVRLARDLCTKSPCPASGRAWFDDLSIRAI